MEQYPHMRRLGNRAILLWLRELPTWGRPIRKAVEQVCGGCSWIRWMQSKRIGMTKGSKKFIQQYYRATVDSMLLLLKTNLIFNSGALVSMKMNCTKLSVVSKEATGMNHRKSVLTIILVLRSRSLANVSMAGCRRASCLRYWNCIILCVWSCNRWNATFRRLRPDTDVRTAWPSICKRNRCDWTLISVEPTAR